MSGDGHVAEPDAQVRHSRTLTLRLRSDGILHGVALPDAQQNLSDARQNLAFAAELAGGCRLPLLMDIRSTGTLSREARSLYAGEEGAATITAMAFVADSAFARVTGNLVMRLVKTRYPVSLFTTEEDATNWLRRHV